jgi:hypothetical protein
MDKSELTKTITFNDKEQLAIYNALKLYIKKLRKELDLQIQDDWCVIRGKWAGLPAPKWATCPGKESHS